MRNEGSEWTKERQDEEDANVQFKFSPLVNGSCYDVIDVPAVPILQRFPSQYPALKASASSGIDTLPFFSPRACAVMREALESMRRYSWHEYLLIFTTAQHSLEIRKGT